MINQYSQYETRDILSLSKSPSYLEYYLKPGSNETGWELYRINGSLGPGPYLQYLQRMFDTYAESDVFPVGKFNQSAIADGNPGTKGVYSDTVLDRTNNKDFKKRCEDGEIIMSPYRRSRITLQCTRSERQISRLIGPSEAWSFISCPVGGSNWVTSISGHKGVRVQYYNPVAKEYGVGNFYLINGVYCYCSSLGRQLVQYTYRYQDGFLNTVDLSALGNNIFQESDNQSQDHVFTQEVLAKANMGDLDLMTAAAELPKTIKSIVDGFYLIAKITRDAKRAEFKLAQSIPDRIKKELIRVKNLEIQKALKRLPSFKQYSRSNPGATLPMYHEFIRDRRDALRNSEEFMRKFESIVRARVLIEVAEATASVWLNYRYNIMPNVYLIRDAGRAIANYEKTYRRYSRKNPKKTDGSLAPELKHTHGFNVVIKRQYELPDDLAKLSRALSADVLVTGYELVPLWSIVFDWFFTIGPMLRALSWNPKFKQNVSCAMYRSSCNGTLPVKDGDVTFYVDVSHEYFRREIINPNSSIGIYWNLELNWKRKLDATAFLFQGTKGSLKSYNS